MRLSEQREKAIRQKQDKKVVRLAALRAKAVTAELLAGFLRGKDDIFCVELVERPWYLSENLQTSDTFAKAVQEALDVALKTPPPRTLQ